MWVQAESPIMTHPEKRWDKNPERKFLPTPDTGQVTKERRRDLIAYYLPALGHAV